MPVVEKFKTKMTKDYLGSLIAAVGLYSPYERGKLIAVSEAASRTTLGGGSDYQFMSPYLDFIAANVEKTSTYLQITPLTITKIKNSNFAEKLTILTAKLETLSTKDYANSYQAHDNVMLKKGIDFYQNEQYSEAEKEFLPYREKSAVANAYLASITARKSAAESNVSKKLQIMDECFVYFETAEKLVETGGDRYVFLLNRIGVFSALPDEIFSKRTVAIEDLKELLGFEISNEEKAIYYLSLFDLLKKSNRISELRILVNESEEYFK